MSKGPGNTEYGNFFQEKFETWARVCWLLLVLVWKQAEKGTLSHLEYLSFANTIQADLPTCARQAFN